MLSISKRIDQARKAFDTRDTITAATLHDPQHSADAMHQESRTKGSWVGTYLKSIVDGGRNGTITPFAVVSGVAGAELGAQVIVSSGLAICWRMDFRLQDRQGKAHLAYALIVLQCLGAVELLAHIACYLAIELRLSGGELIGYRIDDPLRKERRAIELQLVAGSKRSKSLWEHISEETRKIIRFQELDNEFRRVRALIDSDPGELSLTWRDLQPLIRQLSSDDQQWSAGFTEGSTS